MLGLAQAAHVVGEELTQPAKRAAVWYLNHLPADGVCFGDFDDQAIPDAPATPQPRPSPPPRC
jgi:hypothetical protein